MRPSTARLAFLAAASLAIAPASRAEAGGPPDYDFDWAVIGDAGNRATTPSETDGFDLDLGAVDYSYRMSTTEVTAEQWFEFVLAYDDYYTGTRINSRFTSQHISAGSFNPDAPANWRYNAISEPEYPVEVSWEYAARYVNWLHNDKGGEFEDFETGVYDLMAHPDGTGLERSEGARFWIPSHDEWTKAMHWDPDADDGAGRYWRHPHGSDAPPVIGLPEDGGETSATLTQQGIVYLPVGIYDDVTSPWGLQDGSGGVSEWLEDSPGNELLRMWRGSMMLDADLRQDPIEESGVSTFNFGTEGFRIASAIPGPSSAFALGAVFGIANLRRRHREVCSVAR